MATKKRSKEITTEELLSAVVKILENTKKDNVTKDSLFSANEPTKDIQNGFILEVLNEIQKNWKTGDIKNKPRQELAASN